MAAVQFGDVVFEDSTFSAYANLMTEEKSALIRSGALMRDSALDARMAGGSGKVTMPKWDDLPNEDENISNTREWDQYQGQISPTDNSTPGKIRALAEEGVLLSRNKSWSKMYLASELAGSDPMRQMADRFANYRALRLQAAFIATWKGVFADNDAAPVGTEHDQFDLTYDASATPDPGFTPKNFLNATLKMGDSKEQLSLIMVHSQVLHAMECQELIEFRQFAGTDINVPFYLGKEVIVDDAMPHDGNGAFESWIFGLGAMAMGVRTPENAVRSDDKEDAGNGGGQQVLYNRWTHCLHPKGHRFVPAYTEGGPDNTPTAGNLSHADSWERVYPERKQVAVSRLVTKEF